jgi:hypothetical protein
MYSVPSALIFLQSLLLIVRWRGMGLGWGGSGEILVVVGGGDLLCVKVSVVMESLSMGGSELSESDSELESSEELGGGWVF